MIMRKPALAAATAALCMSLVLGGCAALRGNGGPRTPTVGQREAILTRASDIAVDTTIASQQVILPEPFANTDWGQPGGNAPKAMGHPALPPTLTAAWTAQIPGGTSSQRLAAAPVVSGGRLFAIDTTATVHAFDATSGARQWRTQIGDTQSDGQRSRFGGGVSAEGDAVYATSGLGDVAAIDAATGAVRWTVRLGSPLRGAPTVAFGNVFVMSQDNQLFALRASDGNREWQEAGAAAPGSVFGVAAPAAGQGTIVAGFSTGELYAYRYENGRNLWGDALARTSISVSVSTLTDIDAEPVIDRGRVFAIGQGGRMAGYELLTGQRMWEISIAGIATPWVVGDWIFVITDDARMIAVARATGRIRWISQLPRWRDEEDREGPIRWTGPLLAGGRLMAVSTTGLMISVNPADGTVQGTTEISGPTRLAPLVANNMLYVMDDSGRITAWR
jgi:outer membrane protein assembly factor BamB